MSRKKINPFDQEVDNIISKLSKMDPSKPEYTAAVDNLKTLTEARSKRSARVIEPEVLVTAGVAVFQVMAIIWHEKLNVVTTKAIGFVFKPK